MATSPTSEMDARDIPGAPALWGSGEVQLVSPNGLWCEALGLAVAGAVGGQSLCLADGQLLRAGLHVVISTTNEGRVLSTLAQLVRPLKIGQVRLEGLADIDRLIRQQRIHELKAQYCCYLRTDMLPDPQQVAYFAQSLAPLENTQYSTRLMECPLPGRLVLAAEENPNLLATYDDTAFSSLLDAARRPRGFLDLELLGRSWRQQSFDGAKLEGVGIKVVGDPRVWAIIVARPETTARFLLASELGIAALADCCWFVDGTQVQDTESGILKVAAWQCVLSRLIESYPGTAGEVVRLSKRARQQSARFEEEISKASAQTSLDRRCLERLPRLASKLGLGIRMTENQDRLTPISNTQFSKAVTLVKLSLHHRQKILRIARQESAERQFQQQCEIVLQKIVALGPIGARDLARTFDDQRLQLLLPVLNHLFRTEQILKRSDGRFDIPQRWLSKLTLEIC